MTRGKLVFIIHLCIYIFKRVKREREIGVALVSLSWNGSKLRFWCLIIKYNLGLHLTLLGVAQEYTTQLMDYVGHTRQPRNDSYSFLVGEREKHIALSIIDTVSDESLFFFLVK